MLPPLSKNDIVLVSQIRDESRRLPFFLKYYRSLGIKHFIIVDNDSVDGGREMLLRESDVTVICNPGLYIGSWDVVRPVLKDYCQERWCVHVDADEFIVLPEDHPDLPALQRCMATQGSTAFRCPMIDMYSDRSIFNSPVIAGENLFNSSPYFDPPIKLGENILPSSPRARLFGVYPNLEKFPFFFYTSAVDTVGPGKRAAHALANVQIHDISGALAHFKFQDDLFFKTARAILEDSYWNNSAEYKHLARRLRFDSVPYFYGSLKFKSVENFIAAGLCRN